MRLLLPSPKRLMLCYLLGGLMTRDTLGGALIVRGTIELVS